MSGPKAAEIKKNSKSLDCNIERDYSSKNYSFSWNFENDGPNLQLGWLETDKAMAYDLHHFRPQMLFFSYFIFLV